MENLPHHLFLDRARQEMSRAERYCLYLSIVILDVSDFARVFSGETQRAQSIARAICDQLAESLKQVIRSSDVVSDYEKNRIGLLLMETSGPGLQGVVERVGAFASDFLRGQLDAGRRQLVRVYAASFPDEVTTFSQLVTGFATNSEVVH